MKKKNIRSKINKVALKPQNSLIAPFSEGSTWSRLKTFPLLMCQIWPQFRVARILYFYRKNDARWIEEKQHHEKELSSLGKYIQIYIYIYTYILILNKNSCSKACGTLVLLMGCLMGRFPLLNGIFLM